MNTPSKLRRTASRDQSLRYAMRIIGLLLAAVSAFFVTQDVAHATSTTMFFIVGTVLGGLTMLTSFLPAAEPAKLQEAPVTTPVRRA